MVDLIVMYVPEKVPKINRKPEKQSWGPVWKFHFVLKDIALFIFLELWVVTLFPHTQNHTYLIIFLLSFLVGSQDLRRYKPMPLSFFTELP